MVGLTERTAACGTGGPLHASSARLAGLTVHPLGSLWNSRQHGPLFQLKVPSKGVPKVQEMGNHSGQHALRCSRQQPEQQQEQQGKLPSSVGLLAARPWAAPRHRRTASPAAAPMPAVRAGVLLRCLFDASCLRGRRRGGRGGAKGEDWCRRWGRLRSPPGPLACLQA